jgi:branched-chain amino acid transport system ATP-binding protein
VTDRGSLHVEELSISRGGRRVVADLSLEVRRGEVTALLGPHGAGKSSTVLAIAGILPRARGRVVLDGEGLTKARPDVIRRRGIAVVPEGHRVLGQLTVEDNLRVATMSLRRREVVPAIERVLDVFPELKALLPRPAALLSGGEQQMLALAQGLATEPRYLVIDELSFGLAPVIVRRLATTLGRVTATGTGILLIEQFTAVALSVATTVYVLEGGRLRFSGSASELRDRPEILHTAYLAGNEGARID